MRFKLFSFLCVLFLVFVMCTGGGVSDEEKPSIVFYGNGYEYLKSKAYRTYTDEELADIFQKRDSNIQNLFKEKKFSAIADLFGERGEVFRGDGRTFLGKKEIALCFEEIHEPEMDDIVFRTDYVRMELRDWLLKRKDERDFLYRIQVIMRISYDLKGGSPHYAVLEGGWLHPRITFGG